MKTNTLTKQKQNKNETKNNKKKGTFGTRRFGRVTHPSMKTPRSSFSQTPHSREPREPLAYSLQTRFPIRSSRALRGQSETAPSWMTLPLIPSSRSSPVSYRRSTPSDLASTKTGTITFSNEVHVFLLETVLTAVF